jgi:hypothetical protein
VRQADETVAGRAASWTHLKGEPARGHPMRNDTVVTVHYTVVH